MFNQSRAIRIIDSSVYIAILKVPQHKTFPGQFDEVEQHLEDYIKSNDTLVLPISTIIETGNHIASAADGRRHKIIELFKRDVLKAYHGEAPYEIAGMNVDELLPAWLDLFCNLAGSNIGMGDVICINIYEQYCKIYGSTREISIWSYDSKLQGYNSKFHTKT